VAVCVCVCVCVKNRAGKINTLLLKRKALSPASKPVKTCPKMLVFFTIQLGFDFPKLSRKEK